MDLHSTLETSLKLNEVGPIRVDPITSAPSQFDEIIPTDSVGTTTVPSSTFPFVREKGSDARYQRRKITTSHTKTADLSDSFPALTPIMVQSKEEPETHRNTVTQGIMSSSYADNSQTEEHRNIAIPKQGPIFILHSAYAPDKTAEELETASSISRLTTLATTTTPYIKTMPSRITQHGRKRPYGRRRRPNRIRQRPKPLPRVALTTEAIPIIPRTSEIEAVTKTSSATLENPDLKNIKIKARKEEHVESTPSLIPDSGVTEKITKIRDVITTLSFKPTTSPPEAKHVTHPTSPETLELPVTIPVTILPSYAVHDALPTKESSVPLKPEQSEVPAYLSLDKVSVEDTKADSKTVDHKAEQPRTTTSAYRNSSVLPKSQEPNLFDLEVVVNETTAGTFPPAYPTVSDLSIPVGTVEIFKDPSVSKEPLKPTVSIEIPAKAEPPQQYEIITLSSSFSTAEAQTFPVRETKKFVTSQAGTEPSFLDREETMLHVFHHLQTTQKPPITSTAFIPFINLVTVPPSISSISHPSLYYSTKDSNAFNQERFPEAKQVGAGGDKIDTTSKQNVHPTPSSNENRISIQSKETQFKELYSSKSNNSLLLNLNLPHPPPGMIPSTNQRLPVVPPKHIPVRGTMKPPVTQSYFITHQPLHYTNKPEITAYAAHTIQDRKTFASQRETTTPTQASPFSKTNPLTESKFSSQGQNRYNINSRFFGNNHVPDNRGTAGRLPNQAIPYYPGSRIPFLFNRTRIFPHLNMHPKPDVPSQLVPKDANEKKVAQVLPTGITVQKATAVPVPPVPHATTTTSPPVILKITPPAFLPQRTKPQITTTVHPFKSVHHRHQKFPSVPHMGGIMPHNSTVIQSSTNFRVHGERPKIITKASQSISILAETDAFIPCDAVGEPKPFITWTKVSTGKTEKNVYFHVVCRGIAQKCNMITGVVQNTEKYFLSLNNHCSENY